MAEEPRASLPDLWKAFDEIKSRRTYAAGSLLFEEDSPAIGIFLIESGQVSIRVLTARGRRRRLAIGGPGTMLGLSEVISGGHYKVSAQTVVPTEVFLVSRDDLMEFLAAHPPVCMQIVRVLSEDLHSLYHQFRNLGPGPTRRRTSEGKFF